jgi:hypothetical protein
VRHIKNADGNEMHVKYGVYEYPFPTDASHIETHSKWVDDPAVYQLIFWKEYRGQKMLADVNNFAEGENEVLMRGLGSEKYKTINITLLIESQGSPHEVYHKAATKDPDRFEAMLERFRGGLIHAYDPITRTGFYDCRHCYLMPADQDII